MRDIAHEFPCAPGVGTAQRATPGAPPTLPDILGIEDVAAALRIAPKTARRLVTSGRIGPWARVGKRLYLTREALLAALARPSGQDPPPRRSPLLPKPDPQIVLVLQRPRRGGKRSDGEDQE